jgi:hypothetical protein
MHTHTHALALVPCSLVFIFPLSSIHNTSCMAYAQGAHTECLISLWEQGLWRRMAWPIPHRVIYVTYHASHTLLAKLLWRLS